jgi:hypothetical protein
MSVVDGYEGFLPPVLAEVMCRAAEIVNFHDQDGFYRIDPVFDDPDADFQLVGRLFPVWTTGLRNVDLPGTGPDLREAWKDAIIRGTELYVRSMQLLTQASTILRVARDRARAAVGPPEAYPPTMEKHFRMLEIRYELASRVTGLLYRFVRHEFDKDPATRGTSYLAYLVSAHFDANRRWTDRMRDASRALQCSRTQEQWKPKAGPPRPRIMGDVLDEAVPDERVRGSNMLHVQMAMDALALGPGARRTIGNLAPGAQPPGALSAAMESKFKGGNEPGVLERIAEFAGDRLDPFQRSAYLVWSDGVNQRNLAPLKQWIHEWETTVAEARKRRAENERDATKRGRPGSGAGVGSADPGEFS